MRHLLISSIIALSALAWGIPPENAIASGNYKAAIYEYQRLWKQNPQNTTMQKQINDLEIMIEAERAYYNGDYDQALTLYEAIPTLGARAIENTIKIIQLEHTAHNALQQGDIQTVTDSYAKILVLHPSSNRILEALHVIQKDHIQQRTELYTNLALGQWAKAQSSLQRLWAKTPNDLELDEISRGLAYITEAEQCYSTGDYSKAMQLYGKSKSFFPNNKTIDTILLKIYTVQQLEDQGQFYQLKGDYTTAYYRFKKAALLNPNNEKLNEKLTELEKALAQ